LTTCFAQLANSSLRGANAVVNADDLLLVFVAKTEMVSLRETLYLRISDE
jgi:hypothetical protein